MATSKRNFRRGQQARIVSGNYPARYMGRAAQVVGTETVKGRRRFLLDFSPRRETPLSVAPSHLAAAE